jgi:hypothetical protein
MKRRRAFFCAVRVGAALVAAVFFSVSLPAQPEYVVEKDVWIPLRDGVRLQADVWRPRGEGKFPTLVYRTPYNRSAGQSDNSIYAKAVRRGYAVVMVDVRGRYGSEGDYLPYQQEGKDGFDTIEWAAVQPWSNGAVGTFGLSYPGAVQWLAAMEQPPHLKAMVPAMTFSTPRNFFYSGGVFDMSWIGWIWNNIAPDLRVKKNLPGPRTGREARSEYETLRGKFLGHLPLATLPELQEVAPWYFEWLKHPAYDPWWDWAELRGKYERVKDVAVLNFSAWYDEAYGPEGATTNYMGLVAARKKEKEQKTALVLGPWTHGVPGPEDRVVGERDFGPAAVIDYDGMVLAWMDRYVKTLPCPGGQAPPAPGHLGNPACGPPVHYFVMGPDEWRTADTWSLPQTRRTAFLLASPAAAGKPGLLSRKKNGPPGSYSAFVSDPANPVPDAFPPYTGGHDYSVLAGRPDVVAFETEPLKGDTEVTGPILAAIYVESDAPDTDLWVRLHDVGPDGKAISLMSPGLDVMRASYRNGGARRELLRPGKPYRLVFQNLLTGNVFKKGHRIRVQISATFFPNFSRNLHTGKLEMESAESRKATLRIHHSPTYPSLLLLPLVPPQEKK